MTPYTPSIFSGNITSPVQFSPTSDTSPSSQLNTSIISTSSEKTPTSSRTLPSPAAIIPVPARSCTSTTDIPAPLPPSDTQAASRLRLVLPQADRPASSVLPPVVHGIKRPLETTDGFSAPAPKILSSKKAKLEQRPTYKLNPFNFTGPSINTTTPPSPLFFSNTPLKARPALPPRFSSSEAAASMLSKTQSEENGVKTVTLARGSYTGSPPANRPTPRSRTSADRFSSPRVDSPDVTGTPDSTRLLGQVGITELLDDDERPTFVIDLADPANYSSGTSLSILYANPALRSEPHLLESVSGSPDGQATSPLAPKPFTFFKTWALSPNPGRDLFADALPFLGAGHISWSASTIRKRLRVLRGITSSDFAVSRSSMSIKPSQQPSPLSSRPSEQPSSALAQEEPADYFGTVIVPPTISPSETSTLRAEGSYQGSEKVEQGALGSKSLLAKVSEEVLSSDSSLVNETDPPQEVGFFDWTRLPNGDHLPPHIRFAKSVDWAATALGDMEFWSPDLRQMCNLIMASPHPAAMYWGDDLVAIYNEAYVLLAGRKHPKLMGQSYREAWVEIWDDVKDVFAGAQLTGQATMKDDDCLFLKRHDFLEETYFSWSIIPLVGGDGSVMGLYNPAFEKTRRKIAERRMLTLREVGERTAAARDVKGFWAEVLESLKCNEFDTPFVMLYSIFDDTETDGSSIASSSASAAKQCQLEGSLGVPEDHPAAPFVADLRNSMEGFVPIFREVLKLNKPMVLDVAKGELDEYLMAGLEYRGFGDPTKAVVVCPIHPTTGESTLGFLVMGINPRRPYDDDYALFIQLLSRQLATSLASVVLFEEEIRRGQRAAKLAALDRIELSEQLAARTQEAIESETKFTRMAEFAPVGMFIANAEGRLTYCNDTFYEISRVAKTTHSTDRWIDYVMDEDKQFVRQTWHDLVQRTKPANVEFRFKALWLDRNGVRGDTWVLFSAYPETYDDGSLKSVFGSITNISQQKWAEGLQKRKMEEAVELKRQQENFIDITSHEMRNPLSAILQCADEIITSLGEAKIKAEHADLQDLFASNIDAAQTVLLCAQHQKRIVDDVLTLSKLDSALLMVTPVDVQPLAVVQRALKMFEGELQNADIQLKFVVDKSYRDQGVDWVKCDPSRVLQVLINLTTNAIKFTSQEQKRTIKVTISASSQRPSASVEPIVSYFPSRARKVAITEGADWGEGDEVFINFAVEDTGRGLTPDEMKLLFMRFSQASPRTHITYGGSGLGLFISRELTELQGGEIGVASEAGKGSVFAFFVKARRTAPPSNPVEQLPPVTIGLRVQDSLAAGPREPPPPKTKDFAVDAALNNDAGSATAAEEKQPLHVLIVEDNLVNQRVLQKQLKNAGCVTYVANHGGEALDQLRNSWFWAGKMNDPNVAQINVVLMDQEMPVMDGLTCTKRIRELEEEGLIVGHVPIIGVTANARDEQVKTAIEAGMETVVSKPFRIPDLLPKCEELKARFQPNGKP